MRMFDAWTRCVGQDQDPGQCGCHGPGLSVREMESWF